MLPDLKNALKGVNRGGVKQRSTGETHRLPALCGRKKDTRHRHGTGCKLKLLRQIASWGILEKHSEEYNNRGKEGAKSNKLSTPSGETGDEVKRVTSWGPKKKKRIRCGNGSTIDSGGGTIHNKRIAELNQ